MINKSKNKPLQATISKEAYKRLIAIKKELSEALNMELTTSQAVNYLINDYFKQLETKSAELERSTTAEQLTKLKEKLNIPYEKLSALIDIPESTLKKWMRGIQEPSGENAEKWSRALKKYNIE